jgi:tetratricopeptide (TPR) repeat protein
VTDLATIKYRAFLSYSHSDMSWAKWLHRSIENFRIDKDLIGRETALGRVPKTLRPIFRDREDFSGGHSLTDATIAALDASGALIVLCSTASATRPAVNEEVRLFRSRHPDRPVIPVTIDGQWPENFPSALRHKLAPDGAVTDRPITIIAPDLRETGDGKSLGVAKIIAGLTGLGSDEIFRRAERERRREGRWRNTTIAVLGLLTIAATGSAVYAWQQGRTREEVIDATLKRATTIVNMAVSQAEKYNVPRTATISLLTEAEGFFNDMAQYGLPTPEMRYRKAEMLIEFARNYQILGDTTKQRERAEEAYRLLAALAGERPDNSTYQYELALSYGTVGDVLWSQGIYADALSSFRACVDITEKLVRARSDSASYQSLLAQCYRDIGLILGEQGNQAEAVSALRTGAAIIERAAQVDSGIVQEPGGLSEAYESVGDAVLAEGNHSDALISYRMGFSIRERLAQDEPDNLGRQDHLANAYGKIGLALADEGNLEGALKSCRDGLAIETKIVKNDPSNTVWREHLARLTAQIGYMLAAQGNLAEALKSYRDGLDATEKLVKTDPKNIEWQRNLWDFDGSFGRILLAANHLEEALHVFRAGFEISKKLAEMAPNNVVWQHMLSESYDNVGDALKALSNVDEALLSYRAGLAVADRLLQTNPDDAKSLSIVSRSYYHIGDLLEAQSHPDQALDSYRIGLTIARKLLQTYPDRLDLQRDAAAYSYVVAVKLKAQGNVAEALHSFRENLDSLERLLKTDPSNAEKWLKLLLVSYNNIGDLLDAQGDFAGALGAYRTIAEKLTQSVSGDGLLDELRGLCYGNIGHVLLEQNDRPEALAAYKASLAILEKLARAEPEDVERLLYVVGANRTLAILGDDAPRRWAFIAAALRKLKDQNKLDPQDEKWLPEAEAAARLKSN